MPHASTAATRRHQSFLTRFTRWARRHPLFVRGAVVLVGALLAWACEYAPATGPFAALCRLRVVVHDRAGAILEEALRAKGAAG
jgi:hypothetical protein